MSSFKIGINMAGAISAGAYTAGVLDFLTEALDEWYKAKAAGDAVPLHDVTIEVIAGASAGGMCAAISAVMLQQEFDHIHDAEKRGTSNRFYESWVNRIDIRELLKSDDLKNAPPVISLLDSTIIDNIASYAVSPGTPLSPLRQYISPNLTLFLSLTNLRGIPYSLNGAAPGSVEETTLFFGDRIRFEALRPGTISPPGAFAYSLDFTKPAAKNWEVLRTAAMATGAFPVFLAPRVLERQFCEYVPPMWESVTSTVTGTPPAIPPNFPSSLKEPFATLNVDGGVTNNDPFNYAHDYLASLEPSPTDGENLSADAMHADRAVISIAPFPTSEGFDTVFDVKRKSSVFYALPRLFSALISQSRFFGESLNQIMSGTTFSRFVIAPSDPEFAASRKGAAISPGNQIPALQCAALGAFGGFFERGFRAHDYAMGRRNCQKFLRDYFVLPADSVTMKPALDSLQTAIREQVVAKYRRPAPGTYAESEATLKQEGERVPAAQKTSTDIWMPIIPLCAKIVSDPLPPVPRAKMTNASVKVVVRLILQRYRALAPLFIKQIPFWLLRVFLRIGQPIIRLLVRSPLTKALINQLGDDYQP